MEILEYYTKNKILDKMTWGATCPLLMKNAPYKMPHLQSVNMVATMCIH